MRVTDYLVAMIALAGGTSTFLQRPQAPGDRVIYVVDTVFVKAPSTPAGVDYDQIVARVLEQIKPSSSAPTIIDGDLIVKGRLGVRGAPEPETSYAVTIHGPGGADILFVANEALLDPQRASNQHRHVGAVGVAQDGGFRFGQNTLCFSDARGCPAHDKLRRVAYAGFDSMADMSFYLAEVDSATGASTTPNSQSLVFKLLDWDRNIHIVSHRPGQRIFFNGSTTLSAEDLVWEVPLHGVQK